MRRQILLDTGPLVAVLNRRDIYHGWASEQWARIEPPLLTCEAVLSEACFLLQSAAGGPEAVMELIQRGIIDPTFHLADHRKPVARLIAKYASVPMLLADACLVRMSELHSESAVLTLDRDFRLYRKHGRHVVPVAMPEDR
ncbi:MAG: PIN domain-containing protein [Candidatus Nealsonbacteria bacterium]|nr:PIN domain-containing protein [Candidatus Nealsonbacteria bacterium]